MNDTVNILKKLTNMIENPFHTLTQFAIERRDFEKIYGTIAKKIYNIYPYEGYAFKVWRHEDDWYILHKPSGTLINWYKHCGRINTCNKMLTLE